MFRSGYLLPSILYISTRNKFYENNYKATLGKNIYVVWCESVGDNRRCVSQSERGPVHFSIRFQTLSRESANRLELKI